MANEHYYHSMGSRGHPETGSGKGGHERKSLSEQKKLGEGKTLENADVADSTPAVRR